MTAESSREIGINSQFCIDSRLRNGPINDAALQIKPAPM